MPTRTTARTSAPAPAAPAVADPPDDSQADDISLFGDLLPLEDFQARHGGRLFPSLESLRWYIRQHREALVDAGALLEVNGRLALRPDPFREAVLRIGRQTIVAGTGRAKGLRALEAAR